MKLISDKSRRLFIAQSLITFSGLAFLSCSGGNSESKPDAVTHPLGTPDQGGIGSLVYRNQDVAAVYNFESLSHREFNPGALPTKDLGISASRTGQTTTAELGIDQDADFFIVVLGPDGSVRNRVAIKRTLSKLTSAITFSPDDKFVAFTVEEKKTATNRHRIKRTLVYELATNQVITQIDDQEDPVWIASTRELVVRNSDSGILNLFSTDFINQGRIGDLEITTRNASYDVSSDGQYIVWADGQLIYAYDRNTQLQWTAVEDRVNQIFSPIFAPNGRLLALHGKKSIAYCPHVVPFVVGTTVNLESDIHAITNNTLEETSGRMGWYV